MAVQSNSGYRLPGGQEIQTASSPGQRLFDYQQQSGAATPPQTQINPAGAAQDPFAYTSGSLLTPWDKKFSYTPKPGMAETNDTAPGPGAGGPGGPPAFSFGDVSYNFRDPGAFQADPAFVNAQGPYAGARVGSLAPFQGGPDFQYQTYNPTAYDIRGSLGARPEFQDPGALQIDRYGNAAQFQQPDFSDPNSMAAQALAFRKKQGVEALEASASARGTLRGGDTLQALMTFGQELGSQEYQAAFDREATRFGLTEDARRAAYDRNTAASTLEQQTAYGRASDAYARGTDRFNQDAELSLAEAGLNQGDRQFAADQNFRGSLAANESAYTRRASEYDRSVTNDRYAEATNYDRGRGEYQQNLENDLSIYNMNATNRLNAYQADSASAAAMGRLGLDSTLGTWDRNFQNYSTGFQIEEQRRQQAAAMAAAGAGAGRAQEAMDYARARDEYQMEMDQFNMNQDRQFSRLMAMSQMGLGAAGTLGSFGSSNLGVSNEALYGGANARAAGYMGAANAQANAANTIGNLAMTGALYYGGAGTGGGGYSSPNARTGSQPPPYYFG